MRPPPASGSVTIHPFVNCDFVEVVWNVSIGRNSATSLDAERKW